MTDKEFVAILNKKSHDMGDVLYLIDAYCSETGRPVSDFTKIKDIILHIPHLANSAINNMFDYFKKKLNIMTVGEVNGKTYFYTTLN
jgi:hypothetical protein